MNSRELARQMKIDALNMTFSGGASHIGSILSCVDIVAVLYADVLNVSPKTFNSPNRDRFVLSKGHAGACVYSALAHSGFFDPKLLNNYYKFGSTLSGHVSHKGNFGVECSTGSLGQGITLACGMALAGKLDKKKYRVFTLVGDGECGEGSVWEAVALAGTRKLDNFVVIVDKNELQIFGKNKDILNQNAIVAKLRAFGFDVVSVKDGHDHDELRAAFTIKTDKPLAVVCETVKGKGVSFMENKVEWHGKTVNQEELNIALAEVKGENK